MELSLLCHSPHFFPWWCNSDFRSPILKDWSLHCYTCPWMFNLVCAWIFKKHLTEVSLAHQVISVMFYTDPVLNVYIFCKVYSMIARCSVLSPFAPYSLEWMVFCDPLGLFSSDTEVLTVIGKQELRRNLCAHSCCLCGEVVADAFILHHCTQHGTKPEPSLLALQWLLSSVIFYKTYHFPYFCMHRDLIVFLGLKIKPSAFALDHFISVPLLTIAPLNLLIAEFSARFGKSVYLRQKQAAHQNTASAG